MQSLVRSVKCVTVTATSCSRVSVSVRLTVERCDLHQARRGFAVQRLREIGDPVLRIPAAPVEEHEFGTPELLQLCEDLVETARAANGAGIAAPQIGVSKRVFVVEGSGKNPRYPYKPKIPLTYFCNPEITVLGNGSDNNDTTRIVYDFQDSTYPPPKISLIEGCLSVPGFRGYVQRYARIIIKAREPRMGNVFRLLCQGHAAGTMQHENDHLDCRLFPDLAGTGGIMTAKVFDEWHGSQENPKDNGKFFKDMMAINELYPEAIKEL